jgi:hypothetical protein
MRSEEWAQDYEAWLQDYEAWLLPFVALETSSRTPTGPFFAPAITFGISTIA